MDLRDALLDAMRTWRTRRISRNSASRLIAGGSSGPDEYRGLRTLLDAAKASPAPGELAGEQDAVAGFVTAHRAPTSPPARPDHPHVRGTVRALGVKIAAVAGALAVSGTALAATTGHLPDSAQRRAHDFLGAPAPQHPAGAATPAPTPSVLRPATPSAVSRPPGPAGSSVAPPTTAGATAIPALTDLCRQWLTPPGGTRAVTAAGHRALRAAAGGEKNIGSYCADVLTPPTAEASPTTEAPTPPPPSPAAPQPSPADGGHADNGIPATPTALPGDTDAPHAPDAPALDPAD
jgi:hypothetical protein